MARPHKAQKINNFIAWTDESRDRPVVLRLGFRSKKRLITISLQLPSWRSDGRTYTAEIPTSADSKNKWVANSSPVTHQTLRQQGGTQEESCIHLADWTLRLAAIEKKKITIFLNYAGPLVVDILPRKATMTRSHLYTGTVVPNVVRAATKRGNHKNNMLFHDSAAPHKARGSTQYF